MAAWVGYASSIVGDMLTLDGVRLLWPLKLRVRVPILWKSGGWQESAFNTVALGAALAVRTDSVVMHSGSLVFNGSFTTLMPAWLQGCTYILEAQFDAERFLDTVRREAVTHVMMVPSQVAAMLAAPRRSGKDSTRTTRT